MANKEYDNPFLLKILPVLLLIMVAVSPLRAQDDNPSFCSGSLRISSTAMYIPGSWVMAGIALFAESFMIGFRINI